MKTIVALILSAAVSIAGDLPKLESLTLKSGKAYSSVTITKKTPDGIAIMHESGTARVKFEDLPDDLVKQLGGFDRAAAAKARVEADAKEAAALAEIDQGLAAQGQSKQAADNRKAAVAGSRPVVLKVIQATDAGVLCRIAWFKDQKQGTTSKDSFGRNVTTHKVVPTLTNLSEGFHFVTGLSGAVDGAEIGTAIIEDGTHRYTSVTGAASTVKKWKAIGGSSDATGTTKRPGFTPPVPPSSWLQSVGGC